MVGYSEAAWAMLEPDHRSHLLAQSMRQQIGAEACQAIASTHLNSIYASVDSLDELNTAANAEASTIYTPSGAALVRRRDATGTIG